MCVKMDKIDIYNDSAIILEKNTPKSIISWITILFTLLILVIIFFSIPFNLYKDYFGYVNLSSNNSYLNISIENSDFPINKNNILYIKDDKYYYDVIDIKENEVVLKINLKDEFKIDNNIVVVNVLRDRTTIFKILKNKIRKGFGL